MKALALALALCLAACGPGQVVIANDVVVANRTEPRTALKLTGRVVDQAKLFDAARARALEDRLARLEAATSDQLVVVSVASLDGQPINQFAQALGNRWGIGRANVDNGVVMLVAPRERKIWISVGDGLGGLLTDQRTQGIVDRMLPEFKRGDLPGGIELGVGEIEQALLADKKRPQRAIESARKAA